LAEFVRSVSPSFPDLPTAERLAAETPRQLANAHTFFNVANTILLIGFATPLSRLVNRWVPAPARPEPKLIQPKFIDPIYLQTPDLALQQIRHELGRIGRRLLDMMEAAPLIVLHGRPDRIEVIEEMGKELEELYNRIVDYGRKLGGQNISNSQSHNLQGLLAVGNYLMSAADLLETNFVSMAEEVRENRLVVSPGTRRLMQQLFEGVYDAMRRSLEALENEDFEGAREVIARKPSIDQLADDTNDRLSERLLAEEPNRILLFRIQNEMVNQTKRLYYFAKRIAKAILAEESGEESQFKREV